MTASDFFFSHFDYAQSPGTYVLIGCALLLCLASKLGRQSDR